VKSLSITLKRSDEEIAERFNSLFYVADVAYLLEIDYDYLRLILYVRREQKIPSL